MSNKLCKCGKVGEISCPNDERCGTSITQLPAELPKEWKDKIEGDARTQASLQFHSTYSPDQHTACMITYRQGAMAYASWLYTCQMNYAKLKERCDKMEAALKEICGENGKLIPAKHEMIAIAREGLAWKGGVEPKETLIPLAVYKQQGSKTDLTNPTK